MLATIDLPMFLETEPMPADDPAAPQPILVAYDIRDVLKGIQTGVDAANSALALKADRADLDRLSGEIHQRIDGVVLHQEGINRDVSDQLSTNQSAAARQLGWRDGFMVAAGITTALVIGLVLYIVTG